MNKVSSWSYLLLIDSIDLAYVQDIFNNESYGTKVIDFKLLQRGRAMAGSLRIFGFWEQLLAVVSPKGPTSVVESKGSSAEMVGNVGVCESFFYSGVDAKNEGVEPFTYVLSYALTQAVLK